MLDSRRIEPFDSDPFIYELKIDGFRALAHIQTGEGELISRNGNTGKGKGLLSSLVKVSSIDICRQSAEFD